MIILQSASKIVFVLLAMALIVFTWAGIVDPKDFFAIALLTFQYYFNKNIGNTPPSTDTTKE